MGFFSKLIKGVKGVVKKIARSVKRVAKAVTTALPGGDKLWEFGTKVGKGVMKGIGKITSKLGPIGTMALSFVLAPFIGPMIGALWGSFGAGAAAMAATGSGIVGALGTAGTAIFNGVNFIGGTLGAMGNAITEGIGHVSKGNFGAAGDAFLGNMKSAFTGEAGKAGVAKGIAGIAEAKGFNTEAIKAQVDIKSLDVGMKDINGKSFTPTKADMFGKKFDPTFTGDLANPLSTGVETVKVAGGTIPATTVPAINVNKTTGVIELPKGSERSLLDKGKDLLNKIPKGAAGGGETGDFGSSIDNDLLRTGKTRVGESQAIEAASGGSFFDDLLRQANKRNAGGF